MISLENLLLVWERFLRGKRRKKDVIIFQTRLADNLMSLHNNLTAKTYVHGPYQAFNISDPKPRRIHKALVRDRVIHHLLYKALYDHFDTGFIFDSYSCRNDKGAHKAMNRFKYLAGKVSCNHTRTCYVLKGDIKKFFASIDQLSLLNILQRHIADSDILWLIEQVLASFDSRQHNVGLPLGNLTSQLFANVYLNELDRYVKQELGVKYYIRYVDDFVILATDKNYLKNILPLIANFLQTKLKLSLHSDKVSIKTYSSGLDFLGWVHFTQHRQIRTVTKRRIIKKLAGWPMPETVNSYRGLLGHGDSYKIRKRLGLT